MGNFASGVADGMVANRARSAESAASWAADDADRANRRASAAERASTTTKAELERWVAATKRLHADLVVMTGKASAGLVVMNAIAKALDEMEPAQREKFRDRFVQLARGRMQELDREQKGSKDAINIEDRMRELPENKLLGIV